MKPLSQDPESVGTPTLSKKENETAIQIPLDESVLGPQQQPPSQRFSPAARVLAVRRRLDRVAQILDAAPPWLSRGCLLRLDGDLSGFLDAVRGEFRGSDSRSDSPGFRPASRTPTAHFYTSTKEVTREGVAERVRGTRVKKEQQQRDAHNI